MLLLPEFDGLPHFLLLSLGIAHQGHPGQEGTHEAALGDLDGCPHVQLLLSIRCILARLEALVPAPVIILS